MRSRFLLWTMVAGLLLALPGWSQMAPRPGTIRGQLRLPGGSPAPTGIPVTLIYREGNMAAQTQTDSSGKFSFQMLSPAIYRIKVHAMGYRDIESQDFDVNLSPTYYVSLDLRPDNAPTTPPPGSTISLDLLNVPEAARKDLEGGEALVQKGEYAKSVDFFKRAIKGYPAYAEAYLMLGVAYRAQNNLDEAATALRKCIEINAKLGPAYTALGEIQNDKKEYAEAEKTLLKAVELAPGSSQAQEELARTLWAEQKWQEAEPHAVKALELSPNSPSVHLIMGNISLRKKDGQAALQHFQEYLKLDPEGAMAPRVREMVAKLQNALTQKPTP